MEAYLESHVPGYPKTKGKVRDVYQIDDHRLIIIATDRISAFDYVLPNGVPDKGRLRTGMSLYWFKKLPFKNHVITPDWRLMPRPFNQMSELAGRVMFVKKCTPIPVECVVRGVLTGSAWEEYKKGGKVCGISLPKGLKKNHPLENPIFTPATKAKTGHDQNISYGEMIEHLLKVMTLDEVKELSPILAKVSGDIYSIATTYLLKKGIALADTKFEFGLSRGELILIDEILTPDSSRFWQRPLLPDKEPLSFDKQFVRDWLIQSGWDKNSPPPALPPEIVVKTREKYLEIFQRVVGSSFKY